MYVEGFIVFNKGKTTGEVNMFLVLVDAFVSDSDN